MNFLRKTAYSFPYKGAYGKRKRLKIFYYMGLYINIITFITGNHHAFN